MPIRQSRVIAILNAASEYRSLAKMVEKWFADPRLKYLSQYELLAQIDSWNLQIAIAIDERAAKYNEVIATEFNHFHRNARRNQREALKQQIRRGQQMRPTRRQVPMHSEETNRIILPYANEIDLDKPSYEQPKPQRPFQLSPEDEAELIAFNEANDKALAAEREQNQPFHDKFGKPKSLFPQSSGTTDEYLEHLDQTESDTPE